MEWTMPRPVLQAVAALLVLGAAGSFVMGVIHAPDRGRMPGERAQGGAAAPASVINAPEATPLSQERIEGPPKAVEKPATNTDDSDEEDASDAAATNATPNITPLIKPPAAATNATAATTNTQPTNTTPAEDAPPF